MSFRSFKQKEMLGAKVPTQLRVQLGEIAVRERRSLSEVTTKLLCDALKRDPAEYGIEPFARTPRTQTPATATA